MSPRLLAAFVPLTTALAVLAWLGASPARAQPQPTDLARLERWPGHLDSGKVVVHAVDADGEVLRGALAAKGTAWVTLPVDRRVTGRVSARSRAAALAALLAAEASLAFGKPVLRGKGVNVDLDFHAAGTTDLFRLFSDLMRTNIVVLAPPTNLTIRVKRVPAGAVLAEAVRVAGLAMDRPAPNVIVIRPASRAPVGTFSALDLGSVGGGRRRKPPATPALRLDGHQVRAGILLALVRELDGPLAPADLLKDLRAFCNGGDIIDLRLNKVPTATAMQLIGLAGGIRPTERCGVSRLRPETNPGTLRLLAIVERGTRKLAVVEVDGTDIGYVDDADPDWQVGSSWVTHHDPAGDRDVTLRSDLLPGPPPPSAAPSLRLAATIIDGATRLAVVEVDGVSEVWDSSRPVRVGPDGLGTAEINPGEVRVSVDGAQRTLTLAPR